MLVTEEQAKEMWCPAARSVCVERGADDRLKVVGTVAFNRSEEQDGKRALPTGSVCIGSRCMAWRQELALHNRATGERLEPGTLYLKDDAEMRPTGRGYCGAAGPVK